MSTLKKLRTDFGYTLDALAAKIGVSKQTLIAYEKNSATIPAGKVAALAKLLETDCDSIINNTPPREYHYEVEPDAGTPSSEPTEVRIAIPRENVKKFKEVLLYVLARVGARPNVGQTVLYKLLYFIDFDFYEKFEEQLVGAKYIKNKFGPTPVDFAKITRKMEADGELVVVKDRYFEREQTKYLPIRDADLSGFSARELAHIDECLQKYGGMSAREISAYSHLDVPWIVAKDREPIEYEAVFYRTRETSVRKYDDAG